MSMYSLETYCIHLRRPVLFHGQLLVILSKTCLTHIALNVRELLNDYAVDEQVFFKLLLSYKDTTLLNYLKLLI